MPLWILSPPLLQDSTSLSCPQSNPSQQLQVEIIIFYEIYPIMPLTPVCLTQVQDAWSFILTYYLTPMCSAGIQIWLGLSLLPNPKCSPTVTHSLQSTKLPNIHCSLKSPMIWLLPTSTKGRGLSPLLSPLHLAHSTLDSACLMFLELPKFLPCPVAFVPLWRIHFP